MARARGSGAQAVQGRREYRKHATRRELLTAGRSLFGERGLHESRIEDLTRRVGIGKGTLYGYFASKEALIQAVATAGYEELLGQVRARVRGARGTSDLLARVVRAHLDFYGENPDLMRLFQQAGGGVKSGHPERQTLRRALDDYLGGLAGALALSGGAGRWDARQRREVARLLFGAVSGVASVRPSHVPVSRAHGTTDSVTRALVALLLSYRVASRNGRMRRAGAARASVRPGDRPARRSRRRGVSPARRRARRDRERSARARRGSL
jgi:TetR/AcrR family fatty acid metabolism transcriptional regulator